MHVGRAWRIILADLGIDRVALLKRAGYPPTLFDGDGTYISVDGFYKLYDALLAESNTPELALGAGQVASAELFDPALFAAICSKNFAQAAARLGQFKRLVGAFSLDVTADNDQTRVVYRCKYRPDMPLLMGLSELVFLVAFARRATRERMVPTRINVQQVPTALEPFEEFFGCQLEVSSNYGLVFGAADANRPFLTHNDAMWESFAPTLRERARASAEALTASERVRSALLELLPSGRANLDDVAVALAVGKRTLQRRLRDERTTWVRVLNETRHDLACHYLEKTSLSVPEVSFLLGFEDPNSLYRAFQRWAGTTPESWRAQLRD